MPESFLNLQPYSLASIMYILLPLLLLLLVLIVSFSILKKRTVRNRTLWQQTIASLISQAVFTEEDEVTVDMTDDIAVLLRRTNFRSYLTIELIQAAINLSGASRENLKKLYELLELDKDSLKKLTHRKDHIKARGLQELAMMEQVKYVKKIFKLTNNPNVLVRNEAQCALVGCYGFVGLRFLNVTAYPISEWQQIQLLNKLNRAETTNFDPLKKWLRSPDESVIILSLKLAVYYNCIDVQQEVIHCLQSSNLQVKLYALQYLKKLPGHDSADQIISQYFLADKRYKLAVLEALSTMGDEQHLVFVQQQLRNEDDDIKAAAAICLSLLHPSGIAIFQTQLFADQNPWKGIFHQIKTDRAA